LQNVAAAHGGLQKFRHDITPLKKLGQKRQKRPRLMYRVCMGGDAFVLEPSWVLGLSVAIGVPEV
jgi:hypothetical protein